MPRGFRSKTSEYKTKQQLPLIKKLEHEQTAT
jgi:hypothetical protein